MNPEHPKNGAKHEAYLAVGYSLSDASEREVAALDVIARLRATLATSSCRVIETDASEYGRRFTIETELAGPNGRTGTLVTGWLCAAGASPRLTTNWLKVHREGP
jgi:hypothetical protein